MKVNKENMKKLLESYIEKEEKNQSVPEGYSKEDWKAGYMRALNNILFAVSVHGE